MCVAHRMTIDETINAWLAPIADWLGKVVFFSVPVGGAQLPLIMVWLIMGGIVCTLAFRFVNLRGFRHSLRVIRGDYSSKDHPGEASPFQALSTAVSGTVGLGAIGGVAVAVTLGRSGRGVLDGDRRLPRHEHQVRRGHARREVPASCARTAR